MRRAFDYWTCKGYGNRMRILNYLTRAFVAAVVCGAGFGLLASLFEVQMFSSFDSSVISAVQSWESPGLTTVMKLFTLIGTGMQVTVIALVIMALLYFVLGHRSELILFACVVIGSPLLNEVLKLIFQRARPEINRIIEVNGFSFPSGHSMSAFSLYGILAFLLWKHIRSGAGRIILLIASASLILAIGISRIYLGVHYPSDVIGGYLASGCWLGAAIGVYQYMIERKRGVRE